MIFPLKLSKHFEIQVALLEDEVNNGQNNTNLGHNSYFFFFKFDLLKACQNNANASFKNKRKVS